MSTIAMSTCGAPSAPTSVSNLVVSSKQGNNVTTYVQCTPTTITSASTMCTTRPPADQLV